MTFFSPSVHSTTFSHPSEHSFLVSSVPRALFVFTPLKYWFPLDSVLSLILTQHGLFRQHRVAMNDFCYLLLHRELSSKLQIQLFNWPLNMPIQSKKTNLSLLLLLAKVPPSSYGSACELGRGVWCLPTRSSLHPILPP